MDILSRLEQSTAEDMYSRHNKYKIIQEDIELGLEKPRKLMLPLLQSYLTGTYYESKQLRVSKLKSMDIVAILEDLVILVLETNTNTVPIQNIVGQLATQLDYSEMADRIKTAAEIVAIICHSDLYDIILARDSTSGSMMLKSNFALDTPTSTKLAAHKYLPPLVCKPNWIRANQDSGYLTKKQSVILGGVSHDKPVNLDMLNQANSVEFSLDIRMLALAEKSKKPLDTALKISNHKLMVDSSNIVYQGMLDHDNRFWFDHRYDSRGRMYCSGYNVTYQGSEFKKAALNLHHKELIT